jgi:hypothetical protein
MREVARTSLCIRIRDELGTIFEDEGFAALFPKRGQPALAQWRLALVTILQFLETVFVNSVLNIRRKFGGSLLERISTTSQIWAEY